VYTSTLVSSFTVDTRPSFLVGYVCVLLLSVTNISGPSAW
jgi:hypothetical protein